MSAYQCRGVRYRWVGPVCVAHVRRQIRPWISLCGWDVVVLSRPCLRHRVCCLRSASSQVLGMGSWPLHLRFLCDDVVSSAGCHRPVGIIGQRFPRRVRNREQAQQCRTQRRTQFAGRPRIRIVFFWRRLLDRLSFGGNRSRLTRARRNHPQTRLLTGLQKIDNFFEGPQAPGWFREHSTGKSPLEHAGYGASARCSAQAEKNDVPAA